MERRIVPDGARSPYTSERMTDDAAPSQPPEDPVPPAAGPTPVASEPPPRKRFARPFFFWLFVIILPTSVFFSTLRVFVHELAHGLTALATGGFFLGLRLDRDNRRSPTMAYADAWSDDYEHLVLIAGIASCVVIGTILLWRGHGAKSVLPRLFLLLAASAFLIDWVYAFEGALLWDTTDYDVAVILEETDSLALQTVSLVLLFVAVWGSTFVVARSLFRTWEDIFGPLSKAKAFWVFVFLVAPVPIPTFGVQGAGWAMMAAAVLYISVMIWTIRRRRATVDQPPLGKVAGWAWASWAGVIVATVGMVFLYFGIRLGTYEDCVVLDLHPEERTIAGVRARYGTAGNGGLNRPVSDARIFLATPDGIRFLPSPADDVLGLAWLPSDDRMLVASSEGLFQVDCRSGTPTTLWRSEETWIKSAHPGPGGEWIFVLQPRSWKPGHFGYSLYLFDPRGNVGKLHPFGKTIETPFFTPASPAKAYVTVGDDIWILTWPKGAEGDVRIDREEGTAADGSIEGISSDRRWWGNSEGWWCGNTRVRYRNLYNWGAGNEGFFTMKENGKWQLTTPDGDTSKGGVLLKSSVSLLHFHRGVPWVVLRDGETRPLQQDKPAFRAQLPRPKK